MYERFLQWVERQGLWTWLLVSVVMWLPLVFVAGCAISAVMP